jgi:hypothetical protein
MGAEFEEPQNSGRLAANRSFAVMWLTAGPRVKDRLRDLPDVVRRALNRGAFISVFHCEEEYNE